MFEDEKKKELEAQKRTFEKQKTIELDQLLQAEKTQTSKEVAAPAYGRTKSVPVPRDRRQEAGEALHQEGAAPAYDRTATEPARRRSTTDPPPASERAKSLSQLERSERSRLLANGTKCRYESGTYGWMPAVIQGFNEADSTYNLDCRPHAAADKIQPVKDIAAYEAWPPGTLVAYLS